MAGLRIMVGLDNEYSQTKVGAFRACCGDWLDYVRSLVRDLEGLCRKCLKDWSWRVELGTQGLSRNENEIKDCVKEQKTCESL